MRKSLSIRSNVSRICTRVKLSKDYALVIVDGIVDDVLLLDMSLLAFTT